MVAKQGGGDNSQGDVLLRVKIISHSVFVDMTIGLQNDGTLVSVIGLKYYLILD